MPTTRHGGAQPAPHRRRGREFSEQLRPNPQAAVLRQQGDVDDTDLVREPGIHQPPDWRPVTDDHEKLPVGICTLVVGVLGSELHLDERTFAASFHGSTLVSPRPGAGVEGQEEVVVLGCRVAKLDLRRGGSQIVSHDRRFGARISSNVRPR
jgi:hypothetical protein